MKGVTIGVDLGTSGIRVALVNTEREAVALATMPIDTEQRRMPAAWWLALRRAIGELACQSSLRDVSAIAVNGTSGTVLPADRGGQPLSPASLYNDQADPAHVQLVERAAPSDSPARGGSSPLARALAWRGIEGLAHLLHEADWIAGRLCGRFGRSDWNNALKTGFDPAIPGWPTWLATLDLDPALLPEVLAPGAPLGRLNPQTAADLGLPPHVQVAAGTTDGCAAFLATGAAEEGEAVTSLGTTLTLKLLSPRPVRAPEYGIYSHRIGSLWLPGGASNSGGRALARHFPPERLAEISRRIDPAAASGLDYYPLPCAGERFPVADPGMVPRETPRPPDDGAFLHGLLEGIARIEALGYQRLVELGAPPVRAVFTVGGGAANGAWTAIRARVLGVPLRQPRSFDAAVGTAGLALR